MEFRKERNFIVAYDGVIKLGAWDISSGSFIGKSGKPVKTVPSCFTYRNLPSYRRGTNDLAYAIYWYRTQLSNNYTNVMGAHFEQLLSLGLFPSSIPSLYEKPNLNKKIVEYLKEENQGYYDVLLRLTKDGAGKTYVKAAYKSPDIFKKTVSKKYEGRSIARIQQDNGWYL